MTLRETQLNDGGKYTCKASNEAGSTDVDLILKVLVPPTIDESNIIGNPLAVAKKPFHLECPVSGIPQPHVAWSKDGIPVDFDSGRMQLAQNNQTLVIKEVEISDQGRYTCRATNKGGQAEEDFNLEVIGETLLIDGDTHFVTCFSATDSRTD